jgi:hypothetical protein
MRTIVLITLSLLVIIIPLILDAAQAPVVDPSGILAASRKRGGDGPSAPAPRLPDGTINLGREPGEKGVWALPSVPNFAASTPDTPKGFRGGQRGGAANEPHIPFKPWAAAVYDYTSKNESKYDPEGFCFPPGGPRMMATPFPAEIIQLPQEKRILMIFEGGTHIWREVFMDGRPHPPRDSIESETWIGHSVGHWEGDTLVIDTANYNEGTWLDFWGHPHTNFLHLVERLTRVNKQTLHYEATIDDPGAYTRPWKVSWDIGWKSGFELKEYICNENNIYQQNVRDDFGQPYFGKPKEQN